MSKEYPLEKFVADVQEASAASSENQICAQNYETITKWSTKLNDYHLLAFLGSGATADVLKARNVLEHRFCAIKFMFFAESHRKDIIREIRTLNYLNHPNLVDLLAVSVLNGNTAFIVTPVYRSLGRYNAMSPPYAPMSEKCAGELMYQLLDGVSFMHENGYMHRDLKSDNLMLDDYATLKVVDFGVTRPFSTVEGKGLGKMGTPCGTMYFMAPEVALRFLDDQNPEYDVRAETWSIGVVCCEFLFAKVPYLMFSIKSTAFWEMINALQYETTPKWAEMFDLRKIAPLKKKLSKKCIEFIESCLVGDCAKRKPAIKLMKDDWIKQFKGKKKHIFSELLDDELLKRTKKRYDQINQEMWTAKKAVPGKKVLATVLLRPKDKIYFLDFALDIEDTKHFERNAERSIRAHFLQLTNSKIIDGNQFFYLTEKLLTLARQYLAHKVLAADLVAFTGRIPFEPRTFEDHCLLTVSNDFQQLVANLKQECPEALHLIQEAEQKFPVELDDEVIQKAARKEAPGLGRSSGRADPNRRASTGKTSGLEASSSASSLRSFKERLNRRRKSGPSKYLDFMMSSRVDSDAFD